MVKEIWVDMSCQKVPPLRSAYDPSRIVIMMVGFGIVTSCSRVTLPPGGGFS
uniref:Uncharacterized protein n=1 Tax=Picea sitchensis TaxID=3332 RepID=A0A6B9XWD4_PICSI|nr:hypothetical protein Q903MT_gene5677 [Picea sitchensis]